MNNLLFIFEGIMVSLSSGIILYEFFKLFFVKNNNWKLLKLVIWFFYVLWQFAILQLDQLSWLIKLVINILLILIIGIGNYKGTIVKKLFFSIGLCAIWTLSEILVGFTFILLNLPILKFDLLGSIVSKLFLILLIIIIRRISSSTSKNELSVKYNVMIGCIPFGSIFIVCDLFYLSGKNPEKGTLPMELICSVILLLINVFIFRIYSKLSEQIGLQKENAAYVRQLHLYHQYLSDKEVEIENNRRLRHDLKQYCIFLLKAFEDKDYQKGTDFLLRLIEDKIDREIKIANTDNIVVDAILNYKYTKMKENHIDFQSSLNIPTKLDIDDSDLALVLGNLIDNAIEATMKLADNERRIILTVKWDLGNLFIKVENSYNGKLKTNQFGEIKTTKEDKSIHGFGLLSVKKCAEKYNGMMKTKYNHCIFEVTVLLYSEI